MLPLNQFQSKPTCQFSERKHTNSTRVVLHVDASLANDPVRVPAVDDNGAMVGVVMTEVTENSSGHAASCNLTITENAATSVLCTNSTGARSGTITDFLQASESLQKVPSTNE